MNRRTILQSVRRQVAAKYPVKEWRIRVGDVFDKHGLVVEGYKRVVAYGRIGGRPFFVESIATVELLTSRLPSVNQLLAGSLADNAVHFLNAEL